MPNGLTAIDPEIHYTKKTIYVVDRASRLRGCLVLLCGCAPGGGSSTSSVNFVKGPYYTCWPGADYRWLFTRLRLDQECLSLVYIFILLHRLIYIQVRSWPDIFGRQYLSGTVRTSKSWIYSSSCQIWEWAPRKTLASGYFHLPWGVHVLYSKLKNIPSNQVKCNLLGNY